MLTPNTVLQGRYLVIRQLGQGGMGTVYEALDQRLSSIVALKVAIAETVEARRAFEREASLLANLRHPSLPKVIDFFPEGTTEILVMEYIPGNDLAELLVLRGGAFAPEEVLRWADVVLNALEFLHTRTPPVLHRDIKPGNLKLTKEGELFLLDFGLAKGAAGQMTMLNTNRSVVGYTPVYSSLEQINGTGTDQRSDVYSLGATLYHLMTGVAPTDAVGRATAVMNGDPDPLRPAHDVNPRVSVAVSKVLEQALMMRRMDRPASAADCRAMLQAARRIELPGSKVVPYSPTIISAQPPAQRRDEPSSGQGGEGGAREPAEGGTPDPVPGYESQKTASDTILATTPISHSSVAARPVHVSIERGRKTKRHYGVDHWRYGTGSVSWHRRRLRLWGSQRESDSSEKTAPQPSPTVQESTPGVHQTAAERTAMNANMGMNSNTTNVSNTKSLRRILTPRPTLPRTRRPPTGRRRISRRATLTGLQPPTSSANAPDPEPVETKLSIKRRLKMHASLRVNAAGRLLICAALLLLALGFCQPCVWRVQAASGEKIWKTELRIADPWADSHAYVRLSEIGRGKGVVFSPDISVPGNRKFYESLGFAYFEDPDWRKVLAEIQAFNRSRPESAIKVLLVQTHGTNGHGLKLQASTKRQSLRSYISIGALQEGLESAGVRLCIIAACNAGRLFRPAIYQRLDEQSTDPLFLPPTLGIVNASDGFNPRASSVTIARRTDKLEITHKDDAEMFSEKTRATLKLGVETVGRRKRAARFVVSYLLVQLILHDPRLDLTTTGYQEKTSRRELTSKKRIELLENFFDYLEKIAARDTGEREVEGPQSKANSPLVQSDRAWS